ncbi:MAG TPA: squalene/phytoene synthase family protein [Streptosporangiaceae bacterium]|nr:squalene/phytoene synthase family protein [Streptosporangiaceae bacterium]
MDPSTPNPTPTLAQDITRAGSHQTYFTIRYLADRALRADAYRAYAYFRWVDDVLDAVPGRREERAAFIGRQRALLEGCLRGETVSDGTPEENLLIELAGGIKEKNSGLRTYLQHLMAVMAFDVERRDRVISQGELNQYTYHLSCAVTEALHHFIGHGTYAPHDASRYLAVAAAHITHMLRDTYDDLEAGYFNIPREVLESAHITPADVQSEAYRTWVRQRVGLARGYFRAGRAYLARVQNPRCRLAGFVYIARFESLLESIEADEFSLRPAYPERKGMLAILRASGPLAASLFSSQGPLSGTDPLSPPRTQGKS